MLEKIIEPKGYRDDVKTMFTNRDLKNLIIPLLIEQLLVLLVGIADTLMVSYAGEAAISGVSLVNQINTFFIMVFTAMAAGGAVVASQYIGKKDQENGVEASSQLLMITTMISVLMMVFVLFFNHQILNLIFNEVDQDVMTASMTYMAISAFSFPALAIYNSGAGIYRSMSKTRTIMYISLIMNVVNVVGNSIGIFVLHAGVAGVAVPSLISRTLAAIIMLTLTFNQENLIYVRLQSILRWNQEMIARILSLAVPNSIENGLFQLAKIALSGIVAMFGTSQIAAYGVAQSFWAMAALFIMTMGPAFITVVGRCVGANDYEATNFYMKKLLRITYLGGILWNAFFIMIIPLVLRLYNLPSDTINLVILLCVIHNSLNALLCPSAFALSTGLRASGDVRYTMFSSIFSTVICRVAFSVIFGIYLDMGVVGIALAMVGDWGVKSILIFKRYLSHKWENYRVV